MNADQFEARKSERAAARPTSRRPVAWVGTVALLAAWLAVVPVLVGFVAAMLPGRGGLHEFVRIALLWVCTLVLVGIVYVLVLLVRDQILANFVLVTWVAQGVLGSVTLALDLPRVLVWAGAGCWFVVGCVVSATPGYGPGTQRSPRRRG